MELIVRRMISIVRNNIEDVLNQYANMWQSDDIDFYGEALSIPTPPDHATDYTQRAYYIGEPPKIPHYPAITFLLTGSTFSESENVAKVFFQSERVDVRVRIYHKVALTERPDVLTVGLQRITDSVVYILRTHATLEKTDGTDPLAKTIGMKEVKYHPYINNTRAFLKLSDIDCHYTVLDDVRNRMTLYPTTI